ncbi:hypothetical protein ACTNBM_04440 [Lachnospiraceae bacterium HCP1S3_C3]|nr:hypothetical protein [Lachnospiraceae bacterium]
MIIKLLIVLVFCLLFWLGCYKNTGTDEKICSVSVRIPTKYRI